jgi:hypothetical protein
MSLKTFIEDKSVREKFRNSFKKPKIKLKNDIICKPITNDSGLIGTAFDYSLRFYLEHKINKKIIKKDKWPLSTFANFLDKLNKRNEFLESLIDKLS